MGSAAAHFSAPSPTIVAAGAAAGRRAERRWAWRVLSLLPLLLPYTLRPNVDNRAELIGVRAIVVVTPTNAEHIVAATNTFGKVTIVVVFGRTWNGPSTVGSMTRRNKQETGKKNV